MKELFEKLEKTNTQIANNIEQLGWFLYEISDQDGDHSQVITTLLELNPTFASERPSLVESVIEILNIKPLLPKQLTVNSDHEVQEINKIENIVGSESGEQHKPEEDEVKFQFPKDGVIKVFNERDFKLAICSRDVSQKFLDYAEDRNCPVEILDPVTQENLEELENQCREIQKFWNSGN